MSVTSIKLTEAEKKEWEELAEFDGLSLNQMIREAVNERYEEYKDTLAYTQARKEDDGMRYTPQEVMKELGL